MSAVTTTTTSWTRGVLRHLLLRRRRCCYNTTAVATRRYLSSTNNNKKKKTKNIVVALSGGVDSSVAAALLLQKHDKSEITAIHMSNWSDDTNSTNGSCTASEQDWNDAREVAKHLGISQIKHLKFVSEYWNDVFEPYLLDIAYQGRMGNPDIGCNRHIKFGALQKYIIQTMKHSQSNNNYQLATGHYARIWHPSQDQSIPNYLLQAIEQDSRYADLVYKLQKESTTAGNNSILMAAADLTKDQSYFLAGCTSQQLSNVLFPLGDYYKKTIMPATASASGDDHDTSISRYKTVREIAEELDLPTATKRESMGICFIGKQRRFQSFLREHLPGYDDYDIGGTTTTQFIDIDTGLPIVDGNHPNNNNNKHACMYTIGQGARLSGVSDKYFVCDISIRTNQVLVCKGTHHPALYTDTLTFHMNWMIDDVMPNTLLIEHQPMLMSSSPSSTRTAGLLRVQCRIRHLQPLVHATLYWNIIDTDSSSSSNNTGKRNGLLSRLVFDRPIRGVTPGQMAVLYDDATGLICLGGGPIEKRGPTYCEQNKPIDNNVLLHPAGHNDKSLDGRRQQQ